MKTSASLLIVGAWALSSLAALAQPSFTAPAPVPTVVANPADRRDAYLARVNEVLHWRSSRVNPSDPKSGGIAEVAARLALREDPAWCSAKVIELMKDPGGDMFWMFPVTTVAFLGRDQLKPEAKSAIREAWRTYMPMRGDTENHWAMYYSSLFLMSELYPNDPADRWYNGKSSAENRAEARDYLRHWMDLATTIGQGEYDCTHYIGEYAIPMLMLSTWAEDPEMRQRGRMMLDYIFADFAVDSLNGLYVGSHARTNETGVLERFANLSTYFGWLLFGNCPAPEGYGGWGVFFAAAASHYELPEVVYRIATDRQGTYTHYEKKRTRHRWRNSDVRNAPVYKTTYMTPEYAVGSDQGGLLQPIQQHSWDVTWAVPDPRGVHNTLFSLQAHYSSFELQTYFCEYPDAMAEAVTYQGKPSYNKEDKLLGGSPYQQIFQQDDAVIWVCDVPAGATFEHTNGFFSKDLARVEEDPSGWIFAQGGQAYIAYRPLAPYEWRPLPVGGRRLFSPSRRNGTVVQVAAAREFKTWDDFKAAIRALPLEITLEPGPRVKFTTLRGRRVECAYGVAPKVDGRVVDYAKEWKLFKGPWLNAEVGSRQLTMTHGRLKRVLDFNTLTTSDSVSGN